MYQAQVLDTMQIQCRYSSLHTLTKLLTTQLVVNLQQPHAPVANPNPDRAPSLDWADLVLRNESVLNSVQPRNCRDSRSTIAYWQHGQPLKVKRVCVRARNLIRKWRFGCVISQKIACGAQWPLRGAPRFARRRGALRAHGLKVTGLL